MSSLVSACRRWSALVALGAFPLLASAQPRFDSQGGEYAITGGLQGDQLFSQLALNAFGGYLVWQDNATDGDGFGISARHINRNLSGSLGVFRVNAGGAGDQTLPGVAMLNNGGAVFVWQSGATVKTTVYARFLKPDGTFATGDVPVSSYSGGDQSTPVVASLNDGTVLVVWASVGQEQNADGSPVANGMQGIFAQRFSQTGDKLGHEFQVNTTTPFNQRTPAIATLSNGNAIVVWVTEVYTGTKYAVDENGRTDPTAGVTTFDVFLQGQVLGVDGSKVGGQVDLTSRALVCANPVVTGTGAGFTVAWSGRPNHSLSQAEQDASWDVYARQFALDGSASKPEFRVNTYTYGDQFRPQISYQDGINFVLWTSLMQDGSWEGVVGRLFVDSGDFMSYEFRVNTTTIGKQIYPTVTANGDHTFLAAWSSFVGGATSFDLFAQRYTSTAAQSLPAPAAPYVSALSQTRLSVTWPELSGYTGVQYQVYVDQSTTPVVVTNNSAVIVSLQADSTHSFRLAYVLASGQTSPLSDAASGKTWAEDNNFDGLPDDWQAKYWGNDSSKWPAANADSDGDGATNLQEFLAGTDPTNANSSLRVSMLSTSQGPRLEWNTMAGCIYQVQIQGDGQSWTSIGTPRFAAGQTDSIPVDVGQTIALYRVIRVR